MLLVCVSDKHGAEQAAAWAPRPADGTSGDCGQRVGIGLQPIDAMSAASKTGPRQSPSVLQARHEAALEDYGQEGSLARKDLRGVQLHADEMGVTYMRPWTIYNTRTLTLDSQRTWT